MLLAIGIWVKELTKSNADAGLVILAVVLPSIGGPAAGYLVDRVRRRRYLVFVQLGSAVVLLPLLAVRGEGQVWLIYVVAVLYGISFALLGPGLSALLHAVVPREQLASANGALSTVKEGLRLIGPLVGAGLFVAFGGATVAVVDAITFLAAAGCLVRLDYDDPKPAPMRERLWAEITAGIRHIVRSPALRRAVIATSVALLVVGFNETVIFAVVDQGLHRSPSFLGVLSCAQGVGAILGGLTAASLVRRRGEIPVLAFGLAALAFGCGLWASGSLPVVMAGFAIFGVGLPWLIVAMTTLLQVRTPAELQGRVAGAADVLFGTPQTLSIGLGAAAVSFVNYRILLVVMVVVLGICTIYLLQQSER